MKRRTFAFLLLLVLAVVALAAAGCGGDGSTTTTVQPTTTQSISSTTTLAQSTTTEAVSTTQPAASEKTVTDMAGRSVTLPAEIKSIATFGSIGVLNAFVEVMGCGDKIVNQMSASFTKTDQWKYQNVFAPQIANGPLFENAGEIQIEEVLKAAPDVCLVMTEEEVAVLEGKGLKVLYIEWQELEDVEKAVTLLGEAFGKQDVAADYLEYFDDRVAKAEALAATIPEEEKKTVLYGRISEYIQPHLIAEWWITEAGGLSVTKENNTGQSPVANTGGAYQYTLEDLLAWNPDVMVSARSAEVEQLKQDARLSKVTAIKDNAIFVIPTVAHVWGNRTPEQPLAVMWMMNKLYPTVMTNAMLSEEISYFYSHFFKTDLTDDQIAEIIG